MPISMEEAAAYFEEKKNGTYKCGFCSKEVFKINLVPMRGLVNTGAGTTGVLTIPASPDAGHPNPDHEHTFVSVSCANCGNTTFFHMAQFNAWREQRQKPK